MTDWKSLLRDGDRSGDPVMPEAQVQRIRRIVVSAASDASVSRPMMWPRAFVVTATLLVMICTSVLAGLQRSTRSLDRWQTKQTAMLPKNGDGGDQGARQQLQFTSPGGTRIIWVFDSEFEVKGSLP